MFSSINFQAANRGSPADYDEWEALGAAGWSWQDLLPYFRKLESDADFDGPMHGKDGPLPIQRMKRADWSGYSEAVGQACESAAASRVGKQFGLAASTVRAIDQRYLKRWAAKRRKPALRQMGVDEIFVGKKQKFITVVSNLQTYRFGQGHTFFGFSR